MKNQCIYFFHYEEGHDLCFNITKSNTKNKLSEMFIDLFYFHGVMFHSTLKTK